MRVSIVNLAAMLASTVSGIALPDVDNLPAPTGFAPLNITLADQPGLSKRVEGGVFICTDINWGGTCGFAKQPWDLCIQLDSPWWHSISSIGPDTYNVIVAYEDYSCSSSSKLAIFNPGYSNLVSAGWNDRIGSFRVLQLSGSTCMNQGDFDNPTLYSATNCQACCNGCTRSGTSCCPDGIIC